MNKQETIQHLTELMGVIQNAYFKKGLFAPLDDGAKSGVCGTLWVHEDDDIGTSAISIDLYNFGGDGKPVCDGLKPCTVTYDDNSQDTGWVFCMCYNPDEETPLVFLFSPEDDSGDIDIEPDSLPVEALQSITAWLDKQFEQLETK